MSNEIFGFDSALNQAIQSKNHGISNMEISNQLIIEINETLIAKDERIAELENVISALTIPDETGYIQDVGFVNGFDKLTEEAESVLAKHNSEQQDIAIEAFIKSFIDSVSENVLKDSQYASGVVLRATPSGVVLRAKLGALEKYCDSKVEQLREQVKGGE